MESHRQEGILFGVVWIILSALGEWAARIVIRHNPLYYTASNIGLMVEHAFDFIVVVLIPVFAFVALGIVWAMIRFHVKKGQRVELPTQWARTNRWFVGIWVVGTALINILFVLHSTTTATEHFFAIENPSTPQNRHALVVDVTARQWEWIFSYPQYGLTQTVNRNGQDLLELPVNHVVKLELRSYDPFHTYDQYADVIHSFWVPSWGIKEDVIPGETRTLYITPTRITSYAQNPMSRVQCAEVCGPGHPWMEAPLQVVSTAAFHRWIAQQQALQAHP